MTRKNEKTHDCKQKKKWKENLKKWAIKQKNKLNTEESKNTISYLLVTIMFLMIPFILKLVFFIGGKRTIDIYEDIANGTFIMYAISLIAPIWYTIQINLNSEKKRLELPVDKIFGFIVFGIIIYAAVYTTYLFKQDLNKEFVISVSVLLFIYSIHLAYILHMKEITIEDPNEKRVDDETKIINEMNNMAHNEKPKGINDDNAELIVPDVIDDEE